MLFVRLCDPLLQIFWRAILRHRASFMMMRGCTHNALGWCGGQAHIKAVVEADFFVGLSATISHIFSPTNFEIRLENHMKISTG